MAAAGVPALAVLAIAAAELTALSAERGRMQDFADSVALAGANQLEVTPAYTVVERSEALFRTKMTEAGSRGALQLQVSLVETDAEDKIAGGLKLVAVHTRPSFFGNLLPPGGFVTRAQATALRMRAADGEEAPLCVLALGAKDRVVNLLDSSRVTATSCMAHSDGGISVQGAAALKAKLVQSVGAATGRIEPAANVGAEPLDDPFSELRIVFPGASACLAEPAEYSGTNAVVRAGLHCAKIKVKSGGRIQLEPGEHYFINGGLEAQDGSAIAADDVTLFFDRHSKIDVKDTSQFDASGRRTGGWAGFLIVVERGAGGEFKLWSNNVKRLLGTVYVPDGRLTVDGSATAAEESAWTVVVAKEVLLKGTANLVLNTNYTASSVPVPVGVGNNTEQQTRVRLAR